MKRINRKCKNKYKFAVFFDDILQVRYSNLMNELILTYRNSNISSLISLQYVKLLSKSCRSSVNNVLFFGINADEDIISTVKCYLKSHFAKMGVKREIDQVNLYRELTKDHQFLYLHPESNTLSLHKLDISMSSKK
jgi:hypothetical protein